MSNSTKISSTGISPFSINNSRVAVVSFSTGTFFFMFVICGSILRKNMRQRTSHQMTITVHFRKDAVHYLLIDDLYFLRRRHPQSAWGCSRKFKSPYSSLQKFYIKPQTCSITGVRLLNS